MTAIAPTMTFVGTLFGESGSRLPARIGCLMVLRRVPISFSRFVAAAGSMTATPRGNRLVVNVSIADPTSTLSPSAKDLGSVSGIPFTVLVDKEGNIIDTKLRGAELERALATIFGF